MVLRRLHATATAEVDTAAEVMAALAEEAREADSEAANARSNKSG